MRGVAASTHAEAASPGSCTADGGTEGIPPGGSREGRGRPILTCRQPVAKVTLIHSPIQIRLAIPCTDAVYFRRGKAEARYQEWQACVL